MATPTDRGWWPSRKRPQDESAQGPLPDHVEVTVSRQTGELCLFWRRRDDDALGVVGSLRALDRTVTAAHARAAVALLREIGEAGALRLAKRLEKSTMATPMRVTWHNDEMPARVFRRAMPKESCTYVIEPHSGARCSYAGAYGVDGARGSFCELHARRTAIRVESPICARRRRSYLEKKESAGTPTSTT